MKRFFLWVAGITGLLLLLGYVPTRHLGGPQAVPAMIAGCVASAVAAILGALPVTLGRGRGANALPLVLASMAVRFGAVLVLALALALSGRFERAPLLLWVAVSYLALLGAEVPYTIAATDQHRS